MAPMHTRFAQLAARLAPRLAALAPALFPLWALAGCIAVPIPLGEGHVSAGREVTGAAQATLAPGRTGRAEVLAALGEPSATWDEAGVLVYDWDRVRWIVLWLVGGPGGGAGGVLELPEHHMLLLQFGPDGVLRRTEHARRPDGVSYGAFLRRWAAP